MTCYEYLKYRLPVEFWCESLIEDVIIKHRGSPAEKAFLSLSGRGVYKDSFWIYATPYMQMVLYAVDKYGREEVLRNIKFLEVSGWV